MADVGKFIETLGDPNPIYKSFDDARNLGFNTIPLPPTMPMIAYRLIEIPWELVPPVVHRKQKCIMLHQMFIDQTYTACVTISDHYQKHQITFIKQFLEIYDSNGVLCFNGISELIAGGLK